MPKDLEMDKRFDRSLPTPLRGEGEVTARIGVALLKSSGLVAQIHFAKIILNTAGAATIGSPIS
jgi:hypothetical protein